MSLGVEGCVFSHEGPHVRGECRLAWVASDMEPGGQRDRLSTVIREVITRLLVRALRLVHFTVYPMISGAVSAHGCVANPPRSPLR